MVFHHFLTMALIGFSYALRYKNLSITEIYNFFYY